VKEARLLNVDPDRKILPEEQLTCAPNVVPLNVELPAVLIVRVDVPGVSLMNPSEKSQFPE
jgi:hypothetical protein